MPRPRVLPAAEDPEGRVGAADDDVLPPLDELGDVDEELREEGELLAETAEHLGEDRDDELDEAGRHEQGDRNDDRRVGHGALDLLAEAGRGAEDDREALHDAGELAGLLARDDHVDVHVVEELRIIGHAG